MQADLVIKNYRCFPDTRPARISLRAGFTAFVGVNNSGKSSLLKFFYEFRGLFGMLANANGNLLNALNGMLQGFGQMPSVYDSAELFSNTNNRDLEIQLHFPADPDPHTRIAKPTAITIRILRNTNNWHATLHMPNGETSYRGASLDFEGSTLRHNSSPVADLSKVFEACTELSRMFYVGPFRNAINVGTQQNYFDIQVGQAFFQRWKEYQTGNAKQQNERIYRLTKDIGRIFRFDDLQIQPSLGDTTLQVFINGKSYKLPELGSGLTQFILVLANAAAQEPSYILIDEPELNLHPSLQIDFLITLASYAKRGIMFGTHNLGLARASGERIYSLRKVGEGETEVHQYDSTPRLSEFLGELSFSGYRELGFNRVLLVEGSTDVKVVQQFLRLYGKEHEVVILPLGGSQLINESREAELNEVKRITDKVSALIDSERTAADRELDQTRAAFVKVCRGADIECHPLKLRAMENYLSDRAVKKIKGEKYRAVGPYEKLKEAPLPWPKEENWRIAAEMTVEELKETDLGRFLESL